MAKLKAIRRDRWLSGYCEEDGVEASHTIIKRAGSRGLFAVDALVSPNQWLRLLGFEFSEEDRDSLMLHAERVARFHGPSIETMLESGSVFGIPPARSVSISSSFITEWTLEVDEEAIVDHWTHSAEQILTKLEDANASTEDRITAVLFAETTAFSESEKPRLLGLLFDFAYEHRFSQNDDAMTAVCAAIRKFALNMPDSKFEDYAALFAHTDTNTVQCDIELELAKAIVWRMLKSEYCIESKYPLLEAALAELASDYLRPRLILQKNYASIAMQSTIAIALLNGTRQDEFVERISNMGFDWFRELFSKRLLESAKKRTAFDQHGAENLCRLHAAMIR